MKLYCVNTTGCTLAIRLDTRWVDTAFLDPDSLNLKDVVNDFIAEHENRLSLFGYFLSIYMPKLLLLRCHESQKFPGAPKMACFTCCVVTTA